MSGKRKLNLGCGREKKTGYINLDKEDFGQDIVRDIKRGLPFDDESFLEVTASHFLEHIPCGEELFFTISEIYRILEPEGTLYISVPHTDHQEAFYPDHKSYWNAKMLHALVTDPYQGAKYYSWKIISMSRAGIELRTILEKVK